MRQCTDRIGDNDGAVIDDFLEFRGGLGVWARAKSPERANATATPYSTSRPFDILSAASEP
jgi:hypothetical protein